MEGKKPSTLAIGLLLVAILLFLGAIVSLAMMNLEMGIILLVIGWIFMALFAATARRSAKPVAKAETEESGS